MSLTSYRAAPPRVNLWELGQAGARRGYVTRVSGLGKGLTAGFSSKRHRAPSKKCRMGDKPVLRVGEPVGSALVAIARDIIAEARNGLGHVNGDQAVAVHDYRKAMKRWRAFLRLLEPLVGTEAHSLRVDARDLARRLAGARDVQAMLDALADLEDAEHGLSKTSFTTMRSRIEEAKRAAENTTLTSDLRDELNAALARSAQAV